MFRPEENWVIEPQRSCLHLIPVPLCYQETIYTCGVACVQSILAYYGILYRQDVLIELLKQKPIWGTDAGQIIHLMQTLGFQASIFNNLDISMIKAYIDDGITPILLIQAWKEDDIDYKFCWRDSHYVIACGYDENRIIFMDPYTLGNYTFIFYNQLIQRWHNLDWEGNQCYYCGLIIKNENITASYNPNNIAELK